MLIQSSIHRALRACRDLGIKAGTSVRAAGLRLTLLLTGAIIVGSVIGFAAPSAGPALGTFVDRTILLLVFLLVFEMRLTLARPRAADMRVLALAWCANFLVIPVIGYAVASFFLSGEPLFRLGLFIYFMAPCTDWFLGFTRLARGNTALGATLLPINMVTQLLLYPAYLWLFFRQDTGLPLALAGDALRDWVVAPLITAAALRFVAARFMPGVWLNRLMAVAARVIPAVIAVLVVEIFAANISVLADHLNLLPALFAGAFTFFALTFALGEVVSRAGRLAYPDHVLLTMTTASRNAPLMLAVTMAALPGQPLIYAAIVIGMLVEFPHLTALKAILLARRHRQLKT